VPADPHIRPGFAITGMKQAGFLLCLFDQNIDLFLRRYASTSKEAIRKNQENVAEQLRYQGRILHGADRTRWLRELCSRLIH
jgi:hypothetical protein